MSLVQYALGPRLFATYGSSQSNYEPNVFESLGDRIIDMVSMGCTFGCYASPVIFTFLFSRGYLVSENLGTLTKITSSVGFMFIIAVFLRGIGRKKSPQYTNFIQIYEMPKESSDRTRLLEKFDFDFGYRDVSFDVAKLEGIDNIHLASKSSSNSRASKDLLCDLAAYFAIHSFGIYFIYPGSIKLLQKYMRPILLAGRTKLIEQNYAQRNKIKTIDKNDIDTIFVDNRGKSKNGNTLVICTEGNAGFYEIGIMGTPLNLSYSVLGWNHPGFEASTGSPYPPQEHNAINSVMLFAIHKLGFKPESILLYGWSIGGYSSLWAASTYPNVKGIILDATFDDILHLAVARMPQTVSKIVEAGIRNHCNLNNLELIKLYNGPVTIIRRTEDEIISDNGVLSTNRGNFLLLELLKHRYPLIFKEKVVQDVESILNHPLEKLKLLEENLEADAARLKSYIARNNSEFPMYIGEDFTEDMRRSMALYLVHNYLRDYKSLHCTPLPSDYFQIPWSIAPR